ncbi:MAG: hypothetical protein J6Y43_05580 [Clostridia bacterium]|nr:hypothetical protein [Clostridia bacterium]
MRKNTIFLTPLIIIALCLIISVMPYARRHVVADESFVYGEVDVVSIAPPTVREVNASLKHFIFSVYFDGDITFANYKHMARKAEDLKITIGWANPNITEEAIDFFDENGILASINDCIYFNGKSVREYQRINFDACMIHLGDLGVNNCMNIEFGSNYVPLSDNLDESYTFSFKAGLKLPSGVMLKSDSDWKFMLSDRTFEKKDDSVDASNADFTVNYNGKVLTGEDNLVVITDKNDFSFDKLYIKPQNVDAEITVEKTFDELKEGFNYAFISCTSENGRTTKDLQVVFKYVSGEKNSGGCSSGISSGFGLSGMLLAALFIRRKKK